VVRATNPLNVGVVRSVFLYQSADLYEDEKMRLLVVLASVATIVALPPCAHADPDPDTSFLAELKNAGITYGSGADVVAIGRRACQLMDQGQAEPDVIKGMAQQNAGFTNAGATKFTQIAESVFCPQHTGGAVSPPQPTPGNIEPFFPWPPIPAAL
jgi:hypothetical protein